MKAVLNMAFKEEKLHSWTKQSLKQAKLASRSFEYDLQDQEKHNVNVMGWPSCGQFQGFSIGRQGLVASAAAFG